jgi:hypothetical protein
MLDEPLPDQPQAESSRAQDKSRPRAPIAKQMVDGRPVSNHPWRKFNIRKAPIDQRVYWWDD